MSHAETLSTSVDGKFTAVEIAKNGEINSFVVTKSGGAQVSYKGCGARAVDHPLIANATNASYSFARVWATDGCLIKYTVWR